MMNVLITGGHGFLGKHIKDAVLKEGWRVSIPTHAELNLLSYEQTMNYIGDTRPDKVIHAAATVGGIGYNSTHGARLIYENLQMGINMIEACRRHDVHVGQLIMIGSVCAYPSPLEQLPATEHELWKGYPEPSNGPYGVAKRTLIEMGIQYNKCYGTPIVNLVLANLYGPGDTFDLTRCHVVPALIRKFVDAVEMKEDTVTCWGDGSPTRDLLYVGDAVRAIIGALHSIPGADPINVATQQEVPIQALAEMCGRLTGFEGRIEWDKTLPNGQSRRKYDIRKAWRKLNWLPHVDLHRGLIATIDDYRERRDFIRLNEIPL